MAQRPGFQVRALSLLDLSFRKRGTTGTGREITYLVLYAQVAAATALVYTVYIPGIIFSIEVEIEIYPPSSQPPLSCSPAPARTRGTGDEIITAVATVVAATPAATTTSIPGT